MEKDLTDSDSASAHTSDGEEEDGKEKLLKKVSKRGTEADSVEDGEIAEDSSSSSSSSADSDSDNDNDNGSKAPARFSFIPSVSAYNDKVEAKQPRNIADMHDSDSEDEPLDTSLPVVVPSSDEEDEGYLPRVI